LAMEAGREMDKLVAEKVMGWSGFCCYAAEEDLWGVPPDGKGEGLELNVPIPDYSWDIVAAWRVVERLAEIEGPVSVCWGIYGDEGNRASVMTMFGFGPGVVASTAPLAICRAALIAVMGDK
jgi:hypothetical protein